MKKVLISILAVFMGIFICATPVYADCVKTSIIGNAACDKDNNKVSEDTTKVDGVNYFNCSCDNGSGDSVIDVLKIVVNVLSAGVGLLGVVGITVVGIQYLTAGGKEEQARKAKRRLLEIIIGLAVYAVVFALLSWLLPGGFQAFRR